VHDCHSKSNISTRAALSVLKRRGAHAKLLSQLDDGAKERLLNRSRRTIQSLRDFIVGHPLAVLEQEDQSLLRRQLSERLENFFDQQLLLIMLFNIFRFLVERRKQAVVSIPRHILKHIAPHLFPAQRISAPVIEKGVDHNLSQPGVETRVAAKSVQRLESLEPDLLREVFGVVRVARVVQRERVDTSLKPLRQRGESIRVTRLRAPD